MEIYVDDILIKSLRAYDLCADIKETCQTLRTYGIKLNPNKCLFDSRSRRFLGYIVTERGIEVNSSKVKALQDMPLPRNMKEAQHLTGRITALSRFISKSSDRSLPFFSGMRRATGHSEILKSIKSPNCSITRYPTIQSPPPHALSTSAELLLRLWKLRATPDLEADRHCEEQIGQGETRTRSESLGEDGEAQEQFSGDVFFRFNRGLRVSSIPFEVPINSCLNCMVSGLLPSEQTVIDGAGLLGDCSVQNL
ncbi:uncharacterized protein LOC121978153 [Zingiber officinale]|uniref:uncharacterized protein LOC121978153 n=1 Tax=Zingiber officinale TaxID=94328 RepID=UPI001C4B3414|nr:uncharacterized protein LOC121978153 [Zingiber officinale]